MTARPDTRLHGVRTSGTDRRMLRDEQFGYIRALDAPLAQAMVSAEEPIRAEIFSAERLEQHARSLAAAQAIAGEPRIEVDLFERFRANVAVLRASYRAIAATAGAERAIAPAGEWLLDNFHVIEDQIAAIEEQFQSSGGRRLPRLTQGFLEGHPRLYGIVWAFIAHTDSRLDPECLIRFLNVYQTVDPLEMRELWAAALMLRVVLLENLRRIAATVVRAQRGRELADEYADRMETGTSAVALREDALRLPEGPLGPAFICQLIQRVRYRQPDAMPSLEFLGGWLAERHIDLDDLVQCEHSAQGAANLTAANIISSMRMIAVYDWVRLFERVSLVEGTLQRAPMYGLMDDRTRDRYRQAIEELAERSKHSELAVAELAVAATQETSKPGRGAAATHGDPGDVLIGQGRTDFERRVGYSPRGVQGISRLLVRRAAIFYLGGIGLMTVAALAAIATSGFQGNVAPAALVACLLLGLFPASDIAVALMNRVVTAVFRPRHLPRLRLAAGVPEALRTFVVVPTLLRKEDEVREHVRDLEVHYLSNPEGDVRFAILSDWRDAATGSAPDDEALLALAAQEIAALNARHPLPADAAGKRFYIFHRRRVWNAGEGKWMGWERKRGKLHEFNRLLRGARDTTHMPMPGAAAVEEPPADVRFVITLDADTRLPMDSVRRLVGTAAHPLNAPRFDPATNRAIAGYSIFQPRISPTLPRRDERSAFRAIFSSAGGISPYAGAVSNAYQDLFGEGSYTGKGLYDVDAYERALAGRIADNTVLSHDLFESLYARCALLSDIEFFEDFPSHAEVAAVRTHRWVRGDWQLAGWALGSKGQGLPAIARWKLIDNLRRSLGAPAALALLILGWSVPEIAVSAWLGLILVAFATPGLVGLIDVLLAEQHGRELRTQLREAIHSLRTTAGQVAAETLFLAHNAWLMLDAIVRTLWRLGVTRKHLLEWVTAAQAKAQTTLALGSFNWFLRGGTVLVIAACAAVLYFNPPAFASAAALIVLWWIAPAVARLMSMPPPPERARQVPGRAERMRLRLLARRTWRYFAQFVGAGDNHLPPDNVQEDPSQVVAHRSSPTNVGLYLMSTLAARDFGWLGLEAMAARLEATFATLARLERHHGHFVNWYDTRTLHPLEPRYLSTVDSGNLVACLLVVARTCEEACERPVLDERIRDGLTDTLQALRAALAAIPQSRLKLTATAAELEHAIESVQSLIEDAGTAAKAQHALNASLTPVGHLVELAGVLQSERVDGEGEVLQWARMLLEEVRSHLRDAAAVASTGLPGEQLIERLRAIAAAARRYFAETRFDVLFDPERRLFSIGARLTDGRLTLDTSYYDLLASEARVASFVAIAKREVTQSHWFRLGRRMTLANGRPVLMSWSGSMFEYTMPSLILYTPRGSLLDISCRGAIAYQVEYGAQRGVPWGISESAFNSRDRELTYQYSAFGVQGLGFKRGLGRQLVVAPYATALAAQYDVPAALRNYERLDRLGALGRFGFYDAIDFTARRRPEGQAFVLVRTFMAHHQGMTLVALDNVVHAGVMRHRFHREPIVLAAELLLQESAAHVSAVVVPDSGPAAVEVAPREPPREPVRVLASPHTAAPVTHLLSNGRYAVMLTAAGSGYSVFNRIAVTRWREDPTRDDWGAYIYLRDTDSGDVWSAGYQPTLTEPHRYEVRFAEDRVRISRRDGAVASVLEVIVSSEDAAELRRLVLTNTGTRPREIEITSYSEIALAPGADDAAHPAFSKLFVETEYFAPARGLIARRRPRVQGEPVLWAAHVVARAQPWSSEIEYETDRRAFLGRNRSVRAPLSVMDGRPLSNTTGPVLDPIFSLRTRVRLSPGVAVTVTFATMMAQSRDEIETLADKYHDPAAFERASTLAWTHAQVQLHHLDVSAEQARTFQQLAGRMLYSDPALRPGSDFLGANRLGPSALWPWGISGDRPILLLRVGSADDADVVEQLLRAHDFWRSKRLATDIVILNEKPTSYFEDVQTLLEGMVSTYVRKLHAVADNLGAVYVLRSDRLSAQERALLACAARAVLVAGQGSVAEQVAPRERPSVPAGAHRAAGNRVPAPGVLDVPALEFFNGLGGFAASGREYAIVLAQGKHTPAPWINVIANERCGFIVSESGCGYTWCGNSRQNQLTPWGNDPVADNGGEALYLRDDDTGELWSPTAAPVRVDAAMYIAHHGHGYSRFEHRSHGVFTTLTAFVDVEEPVRILRLVIANESNRRRRIAVAQYLEWTLGPGRGANAHYIVTDVPDPASGVIYARNPWNEEFADAVAFAAIAGGAHGWTCDRREFIGRHGSLREPAGLVGDHVLGARAGAGFDPCSVLMKRLELDPAESCDVVFLLGQGADKGEAQSLVDRALNMDVQGTYRDVVARWRAVLDKVEVASPERSMDLMLNGWLLYQALSCRVWARTGFYQAGGAYGFRDQLQDGMALVTSVPDIVREHLLRAAGRQFVEGDVQHWWHPPAGRGVRTHCSDDRLWLPYAVEHYVRATGDRAVLDVEIGFIEGPLPEPHEEGAYYLPTQSARSASLYAHCAAALDASLEIGVHGLPLIGTGDWNDGMNRVGHRGQGESVWLGWFLYANLKQFAPLAQVRGDAQRAERWLAHAEKLKSALEANGWDGAWYRRAYFDDGTPLGSAANDECRIDAIAQSWGLISGAAEPHRALRAMESVERHLLRRGDELALLFAPPFDHGALDPGYIKAYVPGVRENGGQYTHAAVWTLIGYALLGDGDTALDLFGMLNPINRGSTRTGIYAYRVEPYVVAADVYSSPSHVRLGGWTWYTGSAGWLYRAGLEWILGLRIRGDRLEFGPCVPREWRRFTVRYRHAHALWTITVENPDAVMTGIARITVDGVEQPAATDSVSLQGADGEHDVHVVLGEKA